MDEIRKVSFDMLDINDSFFNSLKESYEEFEEWFKRKSDEGAQAYILEDNGIQGFLYLKLENDIDTSIIPNFSSEKRLKVGTFKVNPHGTKLGERFIKLIFDEMIHEGIKKSYVTVFNKHDDLIELLKKYGYLYWGVKETKNGKEEVYVKDLSIFANDINLDYPRLNTKGKKKFLLAIWPKYHTELFPDSKLYTERAHVIRDSSHTNSIEKIYLSAAFSLPNYNFGDIIVIYRTGDAEKRAEYSAVATSICTVKEIRHLSSFRDFSDFYNYCKKGSIFTTQELEYFWSSARYPYVIKMLYNVALNKRIIRRDLIEEIGISRTDRIVAYDISDEEFKKILEFGGVNESLVIN